MASAKRTKIKIFIHCARDVRNQRTGHQPDTLSDAISGLEVLQEKETKTLGTVLYRDHQTGFSHE